MDYIDTKSTEERTILDLKDVSPNNTLVLGYYKYKKVKGELEMHRHTNMIEICFLEKGSQYYKIESENYILKGGDLLITKPSLLHGTNGFPEDIGCLYWMIINVPGKNQRFLNLSSKETKYLMDRILNIKNPCFRGSYYIQSILNSIIKDYQKRDEPLRDVIIMNKIIDFLLKVIYYGEKGHKADISEQIKLVCQYIQKNLLNDFLLDDLAEMSNLSLSRFQHRFKEEVGIPPAEYINRSKIEKAKEMVKQDEISIQDIAYDLGFSSPLYFSTVFKKFTGVSPSAYRGD